jgi:hypothetical protein
MTSQDKMEANVFLALGVAVVVFVWSRQSTGYGGSLWAFNHCLHYCSDPPGTFSVENPDHVICGRQCRTDHYPDDLPVVRAPSMRRFVNRGRPRHWVNRRRGQQLYSGIGEVF